MSTFGRLIATVKKDLRVTEGLRVTDEDVRAAINDAITFYEAERWHFNEGDASNSLGPTITTVAETGSYILPSTVITVDDVQYLHSNENYSLSRWTWGEHLRAVSDTSVVIGYPSHYTLHGGYIHLYPSPDQATTVTISGIVRLSPSPLSRTADTNAWTTIAAPLIRARSSWDLCLNRLANPDRANDFERAEARAINSLRGRYLDMASTGAAVVDHWDRI